MKHKLNQLILLCMIAGSSFAQSGSDGIRKKHFNLSDGVALHGYDPVAYIVQGKAIKGNAKIETSYSGIIYRFSSEADKVAFAQNPTAYEPQYGGWCAYAMGNTGEKVDVDPETFKVLNGKLYVFYNKYFNNTLKTWNKDEAGLKSKADRNWSNIFK